MKPITQTIFGNGSNGKEPGNCLQAAIASIFDCELDDVPHFVKYQDWFERLQSWLEKYHDMYAFSFDFDERLDVKGYYLLTGIATRGFMHSVVYKDGVMVHDPYPDGQGLMEIKTCCIFVSMLSVYDWSVINLPDYRD